MDKKEYKKNLLERLYKFGYRYIARDSDRCLYAHCYKPKKMGAYWVSEAKSTWLYLFDDLFECVTFEDEEPLSITKELGIVDWENIPEDTKVLVSDNGKTWVRRHFAEFDGERTHKFVVYMHGKSSWTSESDDYRPGYKYCKLTEEE